MLNIRSSHFHHNSNPQRLPRLSTRRRSFLRHASTDVVGADDDYGGNTTDGSGLRFTTILMDDVGIQRDGAVIGEEGDGGIRSQGSKKYEGVYDAGGDFGYGYVNTRYGTGKGGADGKDQAGSGEYNDGTAGSSSTSASASTSGHGPKFGSKAKILMGPGGGSDGGKDKANDDGEHSSA